MATSRSSSPETAMARVYELTTPLGKDAHGNSVLLFRALQAREELGRLPEYHLSAVSTKGDVVPGELLGKSVTVKMELRGGGYRYLNGYVARFAQDGMVGRYFHYRITVHSWLWFL